MSLSCAWKLRERSPGGCRSGVTIWLRPFVVAHNEEAAPNKTMKRISCSPRLDTSALFTCPRDAAILFPPAISNCWTPRALATKSPYFMRRIALALCAFGFANTALSATPSEEMPEFRENGGCIVWPSQALGNKIGQRKIRELRNYPEKELGQKMDLRVFHDEVPKNGALPMNVLETQIKEWVAKRKAS